MNATYHKATMISSTTGRPMSGYWKLPDGRCISDQEFKDMFTEKTTIDQLSWWDDHKLWIKLDGKQILRLVVTDMKEDSRKVGRWLGTLAEDRDGPAWGQARRHTEQEARDLVFLKLEEYMTKYGFKEITMMSRNYREMFA